MTLAPIFSISIYTSLRNICIENVCRHKIKQIFLHLSRQLFDTKFVFSKRQQPFFLTPEIKRCFISMPSLTCPLLLWFTSGQFSISPSNLFTPKICKPTVNPILQSPFLFWYMRNSKLHPGWAITLFYGDLPMPDTKSSVCHILLWFFLWFNCSSILWNPREACVVKHHECTSFNKKVVKSTPQGNKVVFKSSSFYISVQAKCCGVQLNRLLQRWK